MCHNLWQFLLPWCLTLDADPHTPLSLPSPPLSLPWVLSPYTPVCFPGPSAYSSFSWPSSCLLDFPALYYSTTMFLVCFPSSRWYTNYLPSVLPQHFCSIRPFVKSFFIPTHSLYRHFPEFHTTLWSLHFPLSIILGSALTPFLFFVCRHILHTATRSCLATLSSAITLQSPVSFKLPAYLRHSLPVNTCLHSYTSPYAPPSF